jgi:hypothetical protein
MPAGKGKAKIWRDVDAAIADAGWRVRKAKHGKVAYPSDASSAPIWFGGTPSDHRAFRNAVSGLRRAGLAV